MNTDDAVKIIQSAINAKAQPHGGEPAEASEQASTEDRLTVNKQQLEELLKLLEDK
jgi:hypothetical protein